jgi:hypothetical protein
LYRNKGSKKFYVGPKFAVSKVHTLKYFPRILRIRRKNEEYAERKIHFQQCLGTLKGQYCENLMEDGQFTIFLFSAYMEKENTHNGKKRRKTEHISVINGPPGTKL